MPPFIFIGCDLLDLLLGTFAPTSACCPVGARGILHAFLLDRELGAWVVTLLLHCDVVTSALTLL